MGFCLFNNVAVAARHALDRLGRRARAGARLGRSPRQRHERHLLRDRRGAVRQHPPVAALSGHRGADRERHAARARATRSTCRCRRAPATPTGWGWSSTWSCRSPVPTRPTCCSCRPASTRTATTRSRTARSPRSPMPRWPPRCATLSRELDAPLGFVLEGGYDLGALAALGRRDDRGRARRERAPPGPRRAGRRSPTRARDHYRRWWPVLTRLIRSPATAGINEGRRASTAPLPPASKAPQRLALPPGSLVCNGRRKGDRRGAVSALREAMALRAVRPEAVELPPAPAGLTRPDALGRDWPLIDGAPALDALARRP